ncbi:hypothetical protein BS17DRAFT_347490 [Gyrodon lividus]|nr:hypothetical protein BS17DRAFT_347490 [Gyrodon lividus]
MSSSSNYHSSQVHRVNLHSNGKRPFEECGGYDSDPDSSMNNSLQASGSSTSSGNTRLFTTNSSSGPSNREGRNKRARSTSSSDTDVSSSSGSVSTGYNTAQSSSRSDLSFGGPSALPANVVDCPVPSVSSSPPFVSTHDVEMADSHLSIRRPSSPQRNRIPTPAMAEDNLRSSLERFAAFDRQIAALRSSFAVTRSPLPPPLASSGGEDPPAPRDDWDPISSGFLALGSTELPPSGTTLPDSSDVNLAPSNIISPMSSSSDGSASVAVRPSTSSGTPSVSFSPTYSNISRCPPYPSYRPSVSGSSSAAAPERSGNMISSDSELHAFMRPASSDHSAPARFGPRSSISIESLGSASPSSPLASNLEPPSPSSPSPSIISDDLVARYRAVVDELGTVSQRRSRGWQGGVFRDSPIQSVSSGGEGSSLPLGDQLAEQAGSSSQVRLDAPLRVVRNPLEREPVRSVFDVFGIGESARQGRPSARELAASQNHLQPPPRYSFIADLVPHSRASETPGESTRAHARTNANPATATTQSRPPDFHSRLYSSSSWSSIPSSNSLMSESASERRHALALERFRARRLQLSSDADDESEVRWLMNLRGERERGDASVPGTPSLESVVALGSRVPGPGPVRPAMADPVITHALEPFSELFEETERVSREWAARDRAREWVPDRQWDRARELEREREQEWAWQRERERDRSREELLASSYSLGLMTPAREESPRRPSSLSVQPRPPPPQVDSSSSMTTGTTTNGGQYSYSNLNLSSFQSGLFRDSLRRNAEVNQAPSVDGSAGAGAGASASARTRAQTAVSPVIPGRVAESPTVSGLDADDSGSDVDFDDLLDNLVRFATIVDFMALFLRGGVSARIPVKGFGHKLPKLPKTYLDDKCLSTLICVLDLPSSEGAA